jgi:ABC-type hemin transport system ATPase subunit
LQILCAHQYLAHKIFHEVGNGCVLPRFFDWIERDMQMIADLADRIHVLDYGRTIAEGEPESVLNDPKCCGLSGRRGLGLNLVSPLIPA